ncbi:hypothetical protein NKJ06_00380 [Mesorhizobium sp. M0293]|uniref:hypothetical protein n=1 Tax=unclassified Mesorhizobium TaxID=325217 RepID=UPI00333DE0F3
MAHDRAVHRKNPLLIFDHCQQRAADILRACEIAPPVKLRRSASSFAHRSSAADIMTRWFSGAIISCKQAIYTAIR